MPNGAGADASRPNVIERSTRDTLTVAGSSTEHRQSLALRAGEVFNFHTHTYDSLVLHQSCRKADVIECGGLGPEHVSPENGVRISLAARDLDAGRNSGMAWFDYVLLVPMPPEGK